jgi:hypothetical protein
MYMKISDFEEIFGGTANQLVYFISTLFITISVIMFQLLFHRETAST